VVTRGRPCRDGNAGPCVGSPLYRVISSSGVTLGPVISNWLNCEATWKNAGALYASAPLLAAPSAVAQTCALYDSDCDQISDIDEWHNGTDSYNPDSDGDGTDDYWDPMP
jgi:hypothetical protein